MIRGINHITLAVADIERAVAFDVSEADFAAAVRRLEVHGARCWKDNRSEGASYYFLDPDGNKQEIHVGTLQSRLTGYGATPLRACGL